MPSIFDPTLESFAVNRVSLFTANYANNHPVYHDVERDTWVLSRFEDVWQAATDAETFSSDASEADVLLPMLNYSGCATSRSTATTRVSSIYPVTRRRKHGRPGAADSRQTA